jgi:protein involved in polysaccharide export with SLBB domain
MRPMFKSFAKTLVGACLALALAACAAVAVSFPDQDAPMTIANPTEGYVLEPGNRVRVSVFNEVALSGDFAIDAVGNIAFPLVGSIPATGLTAKALGTRLEEYLQRGGFLQNPDVAVEVQTFRPFYVLGEVRQPGEFQYSTGMTVLSAIARAGGYDYRAYEEQVVLVRLVNGEQVQYRAIERTPIQPGDIVKVLERRF